MNRFLSTVLATAVASVPFALPALALDTPADGYELSALPYPASGSTATLSSGAFLLFDGFTIDRYGSNGGLQQTVTTFGGFVFPSFLLVDPTETFAVVGESTNQQILKVDLSTGIVTPLTSIRLNYDAAFESANTIVVSGLGAAPAGNRLIRVNTDTGVATPLCEVPGFSGPVAVAPNGDVYYATFPSPTADVVRWDAAQLTGATLLGLGDATVVSTGFAGGASLEVDPVTGDVYLLENVFATGANTLLRVGPTRASSEELVTGTPGFSTSNLELVAPTGGALFAPYQPGSGGVLRYSTNDFGGTTARYQLTPARPEVTLSGPGSLGSGPFSVQLAGAPANGVAVFVFGAQSLYTPLELPYLFGGQPVLSGIDVGTAIVGPIVATNPAGAASLVYFNNGTLGGSAVIQAICVDPVLGIVGSSTTAFL